MGTSVANYKVELNGSKLSAELAAAVEGVTLEDEINLPALFSIQMNMVNSGSGMWRGTDLKSIKPGDKVKLSLGLDKLQPMISGEITALDLNFGSIPCWTSAGTTCCTGFAWEREAKLF
ncbi:hypothetical protein JI735_29130 [Paenibacillus sonchi]|uniref:Uncharacterized protein n=1 Tax=Paenibacillus sonchi TaxID=373687 RepID=A0A974PB27_9BACL|nr:hypothetical protein [Paenibacillus sonchi]QQZ60511.1 hypothetical protein JI735_29130 [Paenibacillus sonchi]